MTRPAPDPLVLLENGDHSHTSRGDGAMLSATVECLRARWPRARFGVVSASPIRLRLIDPTLSALPDDRPDRWQIEPVAGLELPEQVLDLWWRATRQRLAGRSWRRALRRRGLPASLGELLSGGPPSLAASSLQPALTVAVGGGYFCDMDADRALSVLDTLEWAAARGSVTALTGAGIGPLTHPGLRRRMAQVLPQVDLILVRERLTGPPILAGLGVPPERVVVAGDCAILISRDSLPLERRGRIGVSLRSADYLELEGGDAASLCAAIGEAATTLGAPVRPFTACEWADEDRRANEALARHVRTLEPDLRRSASPQDFADGVATCRVVVTTTYHAAVFALSQGIPAVCVHRSAYHLSKLIGLADLFDGEGMTMVSLHDAGDRAKLASRIVDAWRSADQIAESLRRKAERIRRQLHDGYDRLAALVESRGLGGRRAVGG
jgi:polysaccharide pyruvyl transferase WcaK-like protein